MFIMEKGFYLIIVLEIQLQLTMWATSTDRTRTIRIQTLTTLDGDSTQISHGAIGIKMLQRSVDKTSLLNHLDSTSKVNGKEPPTMVNSVLLKL